MSEEELTKKSVELWNDFADKLSDEAWGKLDSRNPVHELIESGANGSQIQARQILTIKGLVRDSSGNWVPLPIKGNYRDGLDAFEYFVQANGGRKGIVDRSLKTSRTGYLTRRLVDVTHDVIIRSDDCGYDGDGHMMSRNDERKIGFEDRVFGRVLAQDIKIKGGVLAKKGDTLTQDVIDKFAEHQVDEVYVRSPITCQSPLGICRKCYGYNVEKRHEIEMGKAVGVIAAQSVGEPGTQMTMQTFHKGGVQKSDITQGIPRLEELFEARTPKALAEMSSVDGVVTVEKLEDNSHSITIKGTKPVVKYYYVGDAKQVNVKDGDTIKSGDVIFITEDEVAKQAPIDAKVIVRKGVLTLVGNVEAEENITVLPGYDVIVENGAKVRAGDRLTGGNLDVKKLAEIAGVYVAQRYVLNEVQKVFVEQGVSIMDVHLEVIIRQMARLAKVLHPGDTDSLVGSIVNRYIANIRNEIVEKNDKNIALLKPLFLGIKLSALFTEGFLSAVSFENQVRVLTETAITGKIDYLRGMKENVMIGKKIPVGESARIENFYELEDVQNI
jgi:DNA-directed RNA polymerase subunit beta'